jgi:hypothetical protein
MQGAEITARLFPETLRMRAPRGLPAAVAVAARRKHMSPSEWARQSILRSLEADGVRLLDGGQVDMSALRSVPAPVETRA